MNRAHRTRRVDYRANLPGQEEFLNATEKKVIWFGHNGGGKTEALARRFVRVCEGADPICQLGKTLLTCLLVVTGYDAASARDFADQLFELMPEGLVAQVEIGDDGAPVSRASPWYGRGKGFRGRPPRLVVQRGPMRGTVLNIATLGAGELAAAGITADLILVNEPITRDLFEELATRDRAQALGFLWYVLTPIPGAPSQTWIPEIVEGLEEADGAVRFIQTKLTEGALVFPSGRPLENWEKKTLPRIKSWSSASRAMRMGESLEPILDDAFFGDVWRDDLVVSSVPPGINYYLVGNLDHGLKEGRMRLGVTAYHVTGPRRARRLVGYDILDLRGTSANLDAMARLFLDECERRSIDLADIDAWVGDRAIIANQGLVRRDNMMWRGAVLKELRLRAPAHVAKDTIKAPRSLWDIRTPRKRLGSSVYLMEQLRMALADEPPRLYFLDYCVHIAEDVQKWDGSKGSRHKDGLDRLGYGYEQAHRHFGLWRG
jgi:hypothetical protein